MKQCILGVDLGTTNVKAILYGEDGVMLSTATGGYKTYFPQANWAEQSPLEWWDATADAIKKVLAGIDFSAMPLAAVMISAQSPAMVIYDRDDNLLWERVPIWMDRRAEPEKAEIEEALGGAEKVKAIIGADLDAFHQLPKIYWLKKHEPETFEKMAMVDTVNSWINFKLTGQHAIDTLQMFGCYMLMDVNTGSYSGEISKLLGRDIAGFMPPVKNLDEVLGAVTKEASEKTGIPEGTKVLVGTADGCTASLEAGLVDLGMMADVAGTSSLLYYAADRPPEGEFPLTSSPQSFDIPKVPFQYMACMNASGASLKWFTTLVPNELLAVQKEFGISNEYDAVNHIAAGVPAGANKLLYFPYLSGERTPLWTADVKGMFIGATAASGLADFGRAVLEGVAYGIRNNTEIALKQGITLNRINISGGGANSDLWCKIKASMLHMPAYQIKGTGGAAMGDAIVAGYASGFYDSFTEAVLKFQGTAKQIDPDPEWEKVYDELYPLFISMRDHLMGDLHDLNVLKL